MVAVLRARGALAADNRPSCRLPNAAMQLAGAASDPVRGGPQAIAATVATSVQSSCHRRARAETCGLSEPMEGTVQNFSLGLKRARSVKLSFPAPIGHTAGVQYACRPRCAQTPRLAHAGHATSKHQAHAGKRRRGRRFALRP